ERAGQKQLADVDVDTDEDPLHLTIEVDLRVGWSPGTAREAMGHGHDLAEPHLGIIVILCCRATEGRRRPGIRIRPCRPIREPIVGVARAAPPRPARNRWVAGVAATDTPGPARPGSPCTTGSA